MRLDYVYFTLVSPQFNLIEQSRTFAELSYLMFNMTIEPDPDQYNLIPNDHDLDWIQIKSLSTIRNLANIKRTT